MRSQRSLLSPTRDSAVTKPIQETADLPLSGNSKPAGLWKIRFPRQWDVPTVFRIPLARWKTFPKNRTFEVVPYRYYERRAAIGGIEGTRISWPRECILIMIFFAAFVALSCFLGVYFTVEKSYGYSMSDAFTLAGWVVAVGAFISTGVLAHHYPRCNCWEIPRYTADFLGGPQELQTFAELPG